MCCFQEVNFYYWLVMQGCSTGVTADSSHNTSLSECLSINQTKTKGIKQSITRLKLQNFLLTATELSSQRY